jgi:hypothetical protein
MLTNVDLAGVFGRIAGQLQRRFCTLKARYCMGTPCRETVIKTVTNADNRPIAGKAGNRPAKKRDRPHLLNRGIFRTPKKAHRT